jgi:hypothetical protein
MSSATAKTLATIPAVQLDNLGLQTNENRCHRPASERPKRVKEKDKKIAQVRSDVRQEPRSPSSLAQH